jgi:hypothetical protein
MRPCRFSYYFTIPINLAEAPQTLLVRNLMRVLGPYEVLHPKVKPELEPEIKYSHPNFFL